MDKIDEQLWAQIQRGVPTQQIPQQQLPFRAGRVDGLQVVVVNGDQVKLRYDMDFVEAGNGYRFSFIPKGEIWLDDNLQAHEFWPNCYHEAMEVRLMKGGMGYDKAHERCNKVERQLRLRMARGTPNRNP